MAVDGSFCIEFEIERFISRCPNLARVPELNNLLTKGSMLTEEELVNAVAELILHPKYAIPLVGGFRPIAQKILDRAVALLHLVPNLKSNSDDSMDIDEDEVTEETEKLNDGEVVHLIDFYVRKERGLDLHEFACLAFSRVLDLIPSLLGSVLNYFKFAPPPFERLTSGELISGTIASAGSKLLGVVRVSYRLLLTDPEVFTTLWDWSCFLDLVKLCAEFDKDGDAKFLKNVADIRWCGIQILSAILKLSDTATANFGLGTDEAFTCLLRWKEFCEDVSLEKAGWYLESFDVKKSESISNNMNPYQSHSLQSLGLGSLDIRSSKIHETGPSNWSGNQPTWAVTSTGNPFVLTSAMKKSFAMVLLAVSQRWPVLLYGPAGAGKTALISKLAQDYGSRVLSIHMDEQIDGKMLIGSYVCTEQPGEFRWQPGSLTQAVLNGFWVVFEDIDKAAPDVQSILLPLLEGGSTFLTGHGEAVRVAEGFRLFSTVSSSKLDVSRGSGGRNSLGTLWRRVMIGSSSNTDLLSIVNAWYPDLCPLAEKLIETFERVNLLAGFHLGTSGSLSSIGRFSLRDLLKWCKRIAGLGFSFGGDGLSAYVCSSIYQEAVDIFAAFSSSSENRLTIMKEIAKMWAVPPTETFYPVNKPAIQELRSDLRIGRITLQRTQTAFHHEKKPFVEIRTSLHALERIACSVKYNEPVLFVGETGTGKTTLVQNLATRLGQKLTVLNLSQQSDVADLLGGFKPMSAQFVCFPLYMEFENLFTNTFSSKGNEDFLVRLKKFLSDKNWKMLLSGFQKGVRKIVEIGRSKSGTKRKRPLSEDLLKAWEGFSLKLETAHAQISASDGMIFSFIEGAFITALKNGEWILLDEVNLAPPETLQRVIGVLEEESGSLCLAERGDVDYIHRHPNFRIFACMNPATDAGKRDLPFSIRSRFTEYFVDDVLNDEDLMLFINQFMDENHSNRELIGKIVQFYKAAKKESEERLQDGANQKPQYSLRSLYRALEYTRKARRKFGFQKALYDGFCMFFLNLLDETSAKLMNQLILSHLLGGKVPPQIPFDAYLTVGENLEPNDLLGNYVLTKSVKEHLRNLARAIFVGRYPVLLQGPTSSGKTSLVQFLAATTGHEFVRINNHEHTDLQEYLGSYITDASGKLVFYEGVLVKAVRNGYWIVLDELNLAPSDVLEALNRLLDDNRELFVPELRETIRAHPDFMLFATQNPPTFYGGRKMLSRAFRNRFVEIHVDEIPQDELNTILEKRCKIPGSYSKKMVEVMKELQLHRQSSKVFAGKHGFITPRDLFRWADRFSTFDGKSYKDLSLDGYYLLAERLRDDTEKRVVQEVLERQLRVKLGKEDMYKKEQGSGDSVLELSERSGVSENLGTIIWTRSMRRLYFLVERCYKLREPVLLVGETGGGKTTVCQLLSIYLRVKLHILNCHQYTETSDFLGGFYPVRERSKISSEFKELCEEMMRSMAFIHFPGDARISSDINQASLTLSQLAVIINNYRQGLVSHPDVNLQELETMEQRNLDLVKLYQKWQTIFMWQDGPLVQAMKNGDLFLVDEISLADDSVLERLNSVLEPERKLSLAEKGGSDLEQITAHPNFFILATMNPGGDYGKKELSPALRNRFTEIWVPPVSDLNELKSIARERISNPELSSIVDLMLNFWEWFNNLQAGRLLSVRDLLSWVAFIKVTERSLQPEFAFLHGAFLVLLDGLSLGTGISKSEAADLRRKCLSFLLDELKDLKPCLDYTTLSTMEYYGWADPGMFIETACTDTLGSDSHFGIHPFYVEKGRDHFEVEGFEFLAPTTRKNALRVLRAMQLAKPVLLEGSPGVGKTSLIVALGKFSGHTVVRINLSEQTDIMDLLGSDLPVESDEGMQFAWSDGILLQALKKGYWVLLDELNLAPQSVLEGLNAILDHRAEVFIPELGLTFKCPSSFRVFACQNPSSQGGGRKGLPKSFLNRFTKVYVDELVEDDYVFICSSLYPSIPRPLLSKLILFNKQLHEDTMLHQKFGRDGSPWEFNLRDVTRSCQLIEGAPERSKFDCFLSSVYIQRMRTPADRREVIRLYEEVFGLKPFINMYPRVLLNPRYLIVGDACIKRNHSQTFEVSHSELKILPEMRQNLEAVAHCVQHQWLSILIGPPSSGKTSLIRLLADLTGNELNELNLSSGTDISEILGCFEQYNAFRNYRLAIARVERYINEYCSLQLESSSEAFLRRKDLVSRWLAFLSSTDYYFSTSAASTYVENWRSRSFSSVPLLVEIVEHLRLDMEKNILPVSWSSKDLDIYLKTVRKLQDDYEKRIYSAKFEWVTGLLIKAIENGEWIVLENANLCNPTVLDRINSLVEPSGSITVNECGTVDGKPVILHPHPKFRMFLTVNPSYGEVSRAMRNRGVEIYMMPPYWLLDEASGENYNETELEDVRRFLALSGIPFSELIDSMAKAHIYARDGGVHLNIRITYLELARWVQLFQRLLTNGNRPLWSLQISWEHTYLSSLGEVEGKDIVDHAKFSYLSMHQLYKLDSSSRRPLCLPGRWPTPLNLQDFVRYSKEASVKQNCMYLEFLSAHSASYAFNIALGQCSVEQALSASGSLGMYLVDMKMLHAMMFPKDSNEMVTVYGGKTEYDEARARKMIIFAANWTIEQATESDFELYLLWFSWFGSRLQPFCQFFTSFVSLLKQELEHSIWKCVFRCHREIVSHLLVDIESKPLPVLSLEVLDLSTSDDISKSCSKVLANAIDCAGLLRLSYQQWSAESEYAFSDKTRYFVPVLRSIRRLEEEVLDLIVESPSFDLLLRLYNNLLEDHILFWKGITSSQFEFLLISWRSLVKDVAKLQMFCPREVENFQKESKNLDRVSSWSFRSQKSLLWVHGGHPFLPASADLYQKQCQLLNLCELVWPRKTKMRDMVVTGSSIEAAISSNPELRTLAMQGVCMSTYIIGKADEDESNTVRQLEEMYQMLLGKVDYEKNKMEMNMRTIEPASSMADLSACCIFSPDILCRRAGFDSWLDTLPIVDHTSYFLDTGLLQNLARIVTADEETLQSTLSSLSVHVESALNFSLNFSSRPPTDFLPHQKILWTLDAWTSVDAVNAKISSFVLEMWFRWHTSLWKHSPVVVENLLGLHGYDALLPDMLFQPVKMITVDKILRNTFVVRDYYMHRLQLRVATRYLWQSSPTVANLHGFLLSAAWSLFRQIIFSHKKSFEADKYAEITCIISSIPEKMITQDDINVMISLLASSSHQGLTSLIHPLIEPLLGELNIYHSSTDSIYHLGCAWLRIGGLRYYLLICCDDLDPAVKYYLKYTQLLEKIASLELEIEVRKECVHSAGCFSLRQADRQKAIALENLHAERKRLQRRIVFRSDPGKFKKLKYECDEFINLVTSSFGLAKNIQSLNIQEIIGQVHNWQETASRFVDRLSNEYSAYIDIVQPVQAAVYEMKLGLSLVLSSALHKRFLDRVGQSDMDMVLGAIYSFIRFPRGFASKTVSPVVYSRQANISTCEIKFPTNVGSIDTDLLESLVSFTSDVTAKTDKMVSTVQMKAAFHGNILLRVAYSAAEARFLDTSSFMLLDKIFDEFASFWMNMKVEVKTKEDHEAQQYKFKPRAFKIDNIIEVDISTLGSLVSKESFSEWQEFLSEEESTDGKKSEEGNEALEEDWNFLQESILKDMVDIHNALFGSVDLVQSPGSIQVSEADRLSSFVDSYSLGVKMIKGLEGSLPSSLDAKLTPEHLLRLSLEYENNFLVSDKSAHAYSFYKDSNAPVMAKMVEPLATLQTKIFTLLSEWDDHPALQKILDVIEMILAIPLSTPLAKALSGLQFLLNRVQILRETVSKFPLSDQLDPLLALVSSWQKLEFESWPALLDEMQAEFEINAGKLWFPLYSVLRHRHSTDLKEYSELTIQSLEEYIQTSSIGEFRKRLQLLFAFHGQINTGIRQGSYSSPFQVENVKILYNIFGFYVQFLPLTLEHINAGRKSIELELKELLKLCRWERSDAYTMDNSKRTRQKFKKLIQKYNDLLQQPVMLILNQDAARRGITNKVTQGSTPRVSFERNINILKVACHQSQFRDDERSAWLASWRSKADVAIQNLQVVRTTEFDFPSISFKSAEEVASIISECVSSPSLCTGYQEERKQVWDTIRKICEIAIYCGEIWKEGNKSLRMRRALSDFLKLLDTCGLSKHRSAFLEDQFKTNQSSRWLVQPSYNMQHLLLTDAMTSGQDIDIASLDNLPTSPLESLENEWKIANQYFFRSIASVHQLRQICLNFHKDFTLEQVTRSVSYLDHLIAIQQEQRAAAYDFAGRLKGLKKCILPLENLFSSSGPFAGVSSFSKNQIATFNCMWQQKQLFDGLCVVLHDECLLLRTVENSHLDTCRSVKVSAKQILLFVEKFVPDFQKSKDLLDSYLLGDNGVITTAEVRLQPNGVTKQMEQLVNQNFTLIREFEGRVCAFCKQDVKEGSVEEILLGHLEAIFVKGKLIAEEYDSALQARNHPENMDEDTNHSGGEVSGFEAGFIQALEETYKDIVDAFRKVSSPNYPSVLEESLGYISMWKVIFESNVSSLKLGAICDGLVKTIHFAGEIANHNGSEDPSLGAHLKHLYSLLDPILTYSHGLLLDFLVMHRMVSLMTDELAKVFASLYSQGFPTSTEEQGDESGRDQETTGTGMGEGAGMNDVSDQITDEDQLLATFEKPNEEDDALNDVPSKNDKGIEMEQDFAADTFSVSEESGDDNDDDGDEEQQLDKAIGETGDDSEIVDEKLWDKDENGDDDDNPKNKNEKYESGPSVKDNDPKARELRAKDESAATVDETGDGDLDTGEPTEENDENGDEGPEDTNNMEDMSMDKDEAFTDPTGLKLDEEKPGFEDDKLDEEKPGSDYDMDMDEQEGTDDPVEEGPPEELDESTKEETKNSAEEAINEGESEKLAGDSEREDAENKQENSSDMDSVAANKNEFRSSTSDLVNDHAPNAESATQPKGDSQAAALRDVAPEAQWSNCNDTQNDVASMRGLPNSSENEIAVADSSKGGKLGDDRPKTELPQLDSSSLQKIQPNPCRNIGDALDGWKERVKVSVDLEDNGGEVPDDMVDENAEEYGFTSEFEKGTAQALGTATSDQIDGNINGNEPDGDDGTANRNDQSEMEIEDQQRETRPISSHALNLINKVDEQMEDISKIEKQREGSPEVHSHNDGYQGELNESVVSMRRSYMSDEINQLGKLSVNDDEVLGKARNLEDMSIEMKDNASALWRRYELRTTRLSQELSEQLRLVMEPTLASKLQGDYKTGKRINMKKVIPYIASHYRKDKIWLRRTRPNKRDYQVVIAVDDSRSMSESNCGDVAIEALVTVCRAMSQLEVGNLAVASYGKKGNIRLLHDFDQPFTGEAGVKMLSSLTFKQENTIADEPMVDLLKYLNNMLDDAVTMARLPSGHNPLQQLVLIIADGRFHEKENLKRCVRDLLSKKRMVAFLLLDSPQESIMDLMEASFQGGNVKFSKYLDSFPFPFYVVLKNIEALPRTLADLLRQWFELMQYSRD